MAGAGDLKSPGGISVWVQVPPRLPIRSFMARKPYTNNQKKMIKKGVKYKIKQTGKEDKANIRRERRKTR